MDRSERFAKILKILYEKKGFTRSFIQKELEITPSTFKRDLQYMKDRFHHPICWNPKAERYEYDHNLGEEPFFLPGPRLTSEEIYSFFTLIHLLKKLSHSLLARFVEPISEKMKKAFDEKGVYYRALSEAVKIIPQRYRMITPYFFEKILGAVVEKKRILITYHGRYRNEESMREISPQRLVCYHFNWYLDAFCHTQNEVRTFSIERFKDVRFSNQKYKKIKPAVLDKYLASGYGIFSGGKKQRAVLKFSLQQSRWVKDEHWHSRQKFYEKNGHLYLEVPYTHDAELVMHILQYGDEVEVVSPPDLRKKISEKLLSARKIYE